MIEDSVIQKCADEYERRYRSRTPPKTIQDVLPCYRVMRSEIRDWAFLLELIPENQKGELIVCREFYAALDKRLEKLRKEFGE